jgi:hypothetical protein
MRAWLLLAQLLAPPTATPAAPTEVVVAKTAPDTVVVKATPTTAPAVVEVVKPAVAPEVTVKAGISNEVWIALIGAFVALLTPLIASLVAIMNRLKTADATSKAAAEKQEVIHTLVDGRMSQALAELASANARIGDLQKLVSLMSAPPTPAEVAADPAMVPVKPRPGTGGTGPL